VKHPWKFTGNLAEVPEETGHYALYRSDSISESGGCAVGAGVSRNMRRSLAELSQRRYDLSPTPLYSYLADADGSADKWLRGLESNQIESVPGDT
jgi:hypothetical protein